MTFTARCYKEKFSEVISEENRVSRFGPLQLMYCKTSIWIA
jgi:hypothetical protein